jgi:hypothetical protein
MGTPKRGERIATVSLAFSVVPFLTQVPFTFPMEFASLRLSNPNTSDHEERTEHSVRANGTDPTFWHLAAPSNLISSHDHLGHGSEGILIDSWRSGALVQESPH